MRDAPANLSPGVRRPAFCRHFAATPVWRLAIADQNFRHARSRQLRDKRHTKLMIMLVTLMSRNCRERLPQCRRQLRDGTLGPDRASPWTVRRRHGSGTTSKQDVQDRIGQRQAARAASMPSAPGALTNQLGRSCPDSRTGSAQEGRGIRREEPGHRNHAAGRPCRSGFRAAPPSTGFRRRRRPAPGGLRPKSRAHASRGRSPLGARHGAGLDQVVQNCGRQTPL